MIGILSTISVLLDPTVRGMIPPPVNSCVIAFSNSLFSFISGFAVFASMGYLAYESGVTVDDLPYAGFSLVFGTWPVVFGTLPGGEHWVR